MADIRDSKASGRFQFGIMEVGQHIYDEQERQHAKQAFQLNGLPREKSSLQS